jgi:hypothetical protein
MSFSERAVEMGLNIIEPGTFQYADRFSSILYKQMRTMGQNDEYMANEEIPGVAIYSKGNDGTDEYEYKGILSEIYKFEGNERFIDMVLESIGNLGQVVRDESFILSADNCQILYEVILRDAKTVPQLGDVYPQITIRNSYNGTLKKSIAFGISMNDLTNRVSCSFREKLGEIGQKHTENSQVISMGINEYLNSFTTSIEDFFNLNLNTLLQPDDILATLDLIEKVGKKRRETVSALLGDYDELEDGSRQPISAWSLFLAILRFTSTETNINAKIIVENAAVRNLVFPAQMLTALT